jgi:hypothetical protein
MERFPANCAFRFEYVRGTSNNTDKKFLEQILIMERFPALRISRLSPTGGGQTTSTMPYLGALHCTTTTDSFLSSMKKLKQIRKAASLSLFLGTLQNSRLPVVFNAIKERLL